MAATTIGALGRPSDIRGMCTSQRPLSYVSQATIAIPCESTGTEGSQSLEGLSPTRSSSPPLAVVVGHMKDVGLRPPEGLPGEMDRSVPVGDVVVEVRPERAGQALKRTEDPSVAPARIEAEVAVDLLRPDRPHAACPSKASRGFHTSPLSPGTASKRPSAACRFRSVRGGLRSWQPSKFIHIIQTSDRSWGFAVMSGKSSDRVSSLMRMASTMRGSRAGSGSGFRGVMKASEAPRCGMLLRAASCCAGASGRRRPGCASFGWASSTAERPRLRRISRTLASARADGESGPRRDR